MGNCPVATATQPFSIPGWKGEPFVIFSQVLIHKDKRVNPAIRGFLECVAGTGENRV